MAGGPTGGPGAFALAGPAPETPLVVAGIGAGGSGRGGIAARRVPREGSRLSCGRGWGCVRRMTAAAAEGVAGIAAVRGSPASRRRGGQLEAQRARPVRPVRRRSMNPAMTQHPCGFLPEMLACSPPVLSRHCCPSLSRPAMRRRRSARVRIRRWRVSDRLRPRSWQRVSQRSRRMARTRWTGWCRYRALPPSPCHAR